MGLDMSYQGLPVNAEIITMAQNDPDFAENVFYSLIAYAHNLENNYYYTLEEFHIVRELFIKCPDIKNWNYYPNNRMQDALIYSLNPELYIQTTDYADFLQTYSYRFVKGEKEFSSHLRAGQGILVRYSSPEFIKECVEFTKDISLKQLEQNFIERNLDIDIYKTDSSTDFQDIEEFYNNLTDFYKRIMMQKDVCVFIIED